MRWVGVLLAFATLASPASAATFTVGSTADGAGSCAGTKCSTLRAAVAAADRQPGSTVEPRPVPYDISAYQTEP